MAKTTGTEGAPVDAPVSSSLAGQKYTIAEHCVYAIPPVTKVSYWDGNQLITKSVPNPCPLVPGGEYTKTEIDSLAGHD